MGDILCALTARGSHLCSLAVKKMRNLLLVVSISIAALCSGTNNSNSGRINSNKKGLCVSKKNFDCQDLALFPNISWYYNWGSEYHGQSCNDPPPGFIPMVWGYWGSVPTDIPANHPLILGFNEPDHENQANMSPERALEGWMLLQEAYPERELVSPGTSLKPDGEMVWIDTFMDLCNAVNCRVDYIAVHRYGGTAENIMGMIDDLYRRHGKKIWLTEFAMSGTSNADKVLEFMQDILPMLETHEGVYKYSWFMNRFADTNDHGCPFEDDNKAWCLDKVNSLLEVNMDQPPTLTKLGLFYSQFGN